MLKKSKRQQRKLKKLIATLTTFAAFAFASGDVRAEPVTLTIAEALMYVMGFDAAMATAAAIVSFAVSSTLSYAVGAMTQSAAGGYTSRGLSDRTHMVKSPVAPRTIVYGRAMVSGPLLYIGTSDIGTGTNGIGGSVKTRNGHLHLIVALAGHEIDAVEEIFLNDDPVGATVSGFATGGKFGSIAYDVPTTLKTTIAANASSLTLAGLGAASIISLVDDGGATVVPGMNGGEGGGEPQLDTLGRPLLPNGTVASTPINAALTNANTVSFPAVNYQRNVTLDYVAKGVPTSYVRTKIHLGTPGDAADADLIAEQPGLWTSAHKLNGIAYVYLRLAYDAKIFANGIPNIKALIRGKKVRDPRKGNYPNDVPVWNPNYALCQLDYLKSPDGLNCADSDINLAQVAVAANICDEDVVIRPAAASWGAAGSFNGDWTVTQKRYVANGVIQLDHDVEQNLRSLSTAGGGPVPLIVGGRFEIPVGYYGTPVSRVLTESDLRAAVKVRPRTSRRDLFNAVGGTYVDGRVSWQATDFPEVVNAFYQSQDAGEKIKRDVTFPFTTDEMMAQRLAKILLERSRQAITIDFPGKPCCFPYTVGDLVPVTLAKFGFNAKVFRVIAWNMNSNGTIDLTLQEDAPGIYDWNYGAATTTDLSKDTDLPDPAYIEPVGALTLYSDASELVYASDGTIISRLHVIWPATKDSGVINGGEFVVHYKKASDAYWTPADKVSGASSETWIAPVVDTETYIVRVKAINARGIETDWVYGKHTIIGNSGTPPNVVDFSLAVRADGTRFFKWTTKNQPLTVTSGGGYRLRYRPWNATTAWSDMTPLHAGLLTAGELQTMDPPAGQYDFAIVAVSSNRKESPTPAMISDATIGKEPISYDAAVNLVLNSDWQLTNGLSGVQSLFNWEYTYSSANSLTTDVGRNFTGWNPGRGGCYIHHANSLGNPSEGGASSFEIASSLIPVSVGVRYEVSTLVNAHRCAVGLIVDFFRANNSPVGSSTIDTRDAGNSAAGGTLQSGFADMLQLWGTAIAPPEAVKARVRLIKWNTNSNSSDSYAFWNRVMMCPARSGVTKSTATPWIESSYDQLHGGSLANLSVNSNQIANEAATSTAVVSEATFRQLYGDIDGREMTGILECGYTAPVACAVVCSVTVTFQQYALGARPWGDAAFGRYHAIAVSMIPDPYNGQNPNTWHCDGGEQSFAEVSPIASVPSSDSIAVTTVTFSRRFFMNAGDYRVFRLMGCGTDSYTNCYSVRSTMRLEAIKK